MNLIKLESKITNFDKTSWNYFLFAAFLNAFNDLGHKITIQNILYKNFDGSEQIIWTAVLNLLILLPFIFFYKVAGRKSDENSKPIWMQKLALLAMAFMTLISIGYFFGIFWIAFWGTLLLGIQAAFYSPTKFGFVPQISPTSNLSFANGQIQAVSIGAILVGILGYSAIFEILATGNDIASMMQSLWPISILLILGFLLEFMVLKKISPIHNQINYEKTMTFDKTKFFEASFALAIIFGASQAILAIFPAFAKENFENPSVLAVQATLATSLIGIAIGALSASRLARNSIDLGIASIGGFIFSLSALLLPFSSTLWMCAFLTFLIGLGAGLAIAILNAWLNFNSSESSRGSVMAYSNYIQNISMVLFLAVTAFGAIYEFNSFGLLLASGIFVTILSLAFIYKRPDLFLHTLVCLIFRFRYKIKTQGNENLRNKTPLILCANHSSWIDWALIAIASPNKVIFMMERSIYNKKFLKWFLDIFNVIAVSQNASKNSIHLASRALQNGKIVVIFPEGAISKTDKLGKFHKGAISISKINNVQICPVAISGIWGSIFSRSNKRIKSKIPRREISITFGVPSYFDNEEELKNALQILLCENHF